MKFDKILDFLFHRILGVIVLVGSFFVLITMMSSCLHNDALACFWKCTGCEECSVTCQACSQEENQICHDCFSSFGNCPLNDCLFGANGCTTQCGSCLTTCGGLNYSLCSAACIEFKWCDGCYEENGFDRANCLNCTTYCDAYNDPGSPMYKMIYLFDVTLHWGDTYYEKIELYEATNRFDLHGQGGDYREYNGQIFVGYYTERNGAGMKMTDEYGNLLSLPDKNYPKNLYAHFVNPFENKQFKLEFYERNETGMEIKAAEYTIEEGADLTQYFYRANDIAGKNFVGWTCMCDRHYGELISTTVQFNKYQTFTPREHFSPSYSNYLSGDCYTLKLVASYEATRYTVNFHYPAYLNVNPSMYQFDFAYGDAIPAQNPSQIPGYRFAYLALDPQGAHPLPEDYKVTQTTDIYLIYREEIVITFEETNGSTFTMTYFLGEEVIFPEPKVIAPGKVYAGWTSSKNFSSPTKAAVITEFYRGAKLVPIFDEGHYEIRYEDADGTLIRTDTYTYGSQVSLLSLNEEYRVFEGWYDTTNRVLYKDGKLPADRYGDLVLRAQFTPKQYIITLQPNGGTVNKNEVTVKYNENFTLPIPKRTGYVFKGWSYSTGLSNELATDADGKSLAPFTRYNGASYTDGLNITFKAEWTKATYTITYVANGSTVSAVSVNHGESIPTPPNAPEVAGYTFDKWTVNNAAWHSGMTATADTTVTAVYIPKTYTIHFVIDKTGAAFSNGQKEITVTYTYGDNSLQIPDNVTAEYDGYQLTGWYTNKNGQGSYCVSANWGILNALKQVLASGNQQEQWLYADWVMN